MEKYEDRLPLGSLATLAILATLLPGIFGPLAIILVVLLDDL